MLTELSSHCGVKFRRITEILDDDDSTGSPADGESDAGETNEIRKRKRPLEEERSDCPERLKRRKELICQFRRLRLLNQLPSPSPVTSGRKPDSEIWFSGGPEYHSGSAPFSDTKDDDPFNRYNGKFNAWSSAESLKSHKKYDREFQCSI